MVNTGKEPAITRRKSIIAYILLCIYAVIAFLLNYHTVKQRFLRSRQPAQQTIPTQKASLPVIRETPSPQSKSAQSTRVNDDSNSSAGHQ